MATTNPPKKWPEPKGPWERMVPCTHCPYSHFGANGAAGILLVRRNDTGFATDVVLQHRSATTSFGGTWGLPGGAIDDGESSIQAAIREAEEEAGLPLGSTEGRSPLVIVRKEVRFMDHGVWFYATVIADVVKPWEPRVPEGDEESLAVEWVAISEVSSRKLHPGLESSWAALLGMVRELDPSLTPSRVVRSQGQREAELFIAGAPDAQTRIAEARDRAARELLARRAGAADGGLDFADVGAVIHKITEKIAYAERGLKKGWFSGMSCQLL